VTAVVEGGTRGRLAGKIVISKVLLCTSDIARFLSFKTRNHAILTVDTDHMILREAAGQRV